MFFPNDMGLFSRLFCAFMLTMGVFLVAHFTAGFGLFLLIPIPNEVLGGAVALLVGFGLFKYTYPTVRPMAATEGHEMANMAAQAPGSAGVPLQRDPSKTRAPAKGAKPVATPASAPAKSSQSSGCTIS